MKVRELYEQVSQLGFEDALESDERFVSAANRAIYQINSLRPHIAYLDIVHFPLANLLSNSSLEPLFCQGSKIYNVAIGRAIYFEAIGNGKVIVDFDNKDEDEPSLLDEDFESTGKFKSYRFTLNNPENKPIKIEFKSDYAFTLRHVAVYGTLLSGNKEDVPAYSAFVRYDMKLLTDDYLAFSSPPIVEDKSYKRLVKGYEIESDTLLLPYEERGAYRVAYKRKPKQIVISRDLPANDSTEIDLDEELCTLLPILTASYIWLEDEPDRAMYYKSLYNERVSEIIAFKRSYAPTRAINTNGW